MEQLGKCLSQPKQNLAGISSHLPPWKQYPLLSQEPAEIWASQLAQAKQKSCTFRVSKDPARVRFRQLKPLIDLHSKGLGKPSNPNPTEDRIRNLTDIHILASRCWDVFLTPCISPFIGGKILIASSSRTSWIWPFSNMAPFRVKFHTLVVHGIARNEEETAFAKHLNTERDQNPHQQNVTVLKRDAPRMVRS